MLKRTFSRLVLLLLLSSTSLSAIANRQIDDNIVNLLKTREFSLLDKELNKLQNEFQIDPLSEDDLITAVNAFSRANPSLEKIHNEWITKSPNSAFAYLARGVYYSALGASARGTKFRRETSEKSITNMEFFYKKALADLTKAKSINSNLLGIYTTEMTINIISGTHTQIFETKNTALKKHPYSFRIRALYLWSLEPRWGGSMDEIAAEMNDLKKLYPKNPRLKALDGYISYELGQQALISGNYSEAVKLLSKALESGEYSQYYAVRGDAYSQLKMVPEALKDLEKSLSLWPNNSRSLELAGAHYARQADVTSKDKAIEYLTRAIESNPNNAWTQNFRGVLNINSGEYRKALTDFSKAVELDPTSKEYLNNKELATKAVASLPK